MNSRLPARGERPLVSVVLPVYNGERFVAQTIESALRQTYRNLEIIVVDDGSTDQTASLIEGIAGRTPRVRIFHQPNSGVARARNRGLEESRGEFVAPLDSDDLWDPAKIEEQVRIMQEGGDAIGLVYCWWVWIDDKGVILDRSPSWEIEGDASALLLQVNYTGNASVPLYRRTYLQEVGGYDESMEQRDGRGCEDWDVALRIAARYRVAVARQLLVGYRRLPDSMSTQCDEMWRSRQLLISGAVERDPDLDPQLLRRSTDQFALYVAGVLFRSGAYVRSFGWAARAWRTGLIFRVLPYGFRALANGALSRRPRSSQVMTPGAGLDSSIISPPLIPYDRMYPAQAAVGPAHGSGMLQSKIVQVLFVILTFLFVAGLHRDDDGLAFQGDAPRHAINGFFWYDMATSGTTDLVGFATRYYARYPVINPITYPPLFYLLEGCAFRIFGPTPYAAKALVLLFGILAGCYSMAWARRWVGPVYGWTGVFLALLPGVVVWSTTVMLNVPALALGMASLYHARRWVESGGGKRALICAAFCTATLFTYYQGGIAIAIGLVWALFLRSSRSRSRRALAIVAVALLAAIPVLLAAVFAPDVPAAQCAEPGEADGSGDLDLLPVQLARVGGCGAVSARHAGYCVGHSQRCVEERGAICRNLDPHPTDGILPFACERFALRADRCPGLLSWRGDRDRLPGRALPARIDALAIQGLAIHVLAIHCLTRDARVGRLECIAGSDTAQIRLPRRGFVPASACPGRGHSLRRIP